VRGLRTVLSTERSFRILSIVAVLVIIFALIIGIEDDLLVGLLLIIILILSLEIFNSAVERLVDMLAPKTHHFAKEVKDLLAAAVLLASIFAIVIGFIVFL